MEGRVLRACFGTTKYCNAFLRHQTCGNPECMYLHDIGEAKDSFTKEEMLARYGGGRGGLLGFGGRFGARAAGGAAGGGQKLPRSKTGAGSLSGGVPAPRFPVGSVYAATTAARRAQNQNDSQNAQTKVQTQAQTQVSCQTDLLVKRCIVRPRLLWRLVRPCRHLHWRDHQLTHLHR